MEFSHDLVLKLLSFIREHSDYGQISFHYSEIPGEHSNREIDFHLDYCRDEGYITGQLSGDKIMAMVALTQWGLQYLDSQT